MCRSWPVQTWFATGTSLHHTTKLLEHMLLSKPGSWQSTLPQLCSESYGQSVVTHVCRLTICICDLFNVFFLLICDIMAQVDARGLAGTFVMQASEALLLFTAYAPLHCRHDARAGPASAKG